MTDNKKFEEEITVLFHASLLGRTDILTKVISNIRSMSQDEDEIKNILYYFFDKLFLQIHQNIYNFPNNIF